MSKDPCLVGRQQRRLFDRAVVVALTPDIAIAHEQQRGVGVQLDPARRRLALAALKAHKQMMLAVVVARIVGKLHGDVCQAAGEPE